MTIEKRKALALGAGKELDTAANCKLNAPRNKAKGDDWNTDELEHLLWRMIEEVQEFGAQARAISFRSRGGLLADPEKQLGALADEGGDVINFLRMVYDKILHQAAPSDYSYPWPDPFDEAPQPEEEPKSDRAHWRVGDRTMAVRTTDFKGHIEPLLAAMRGQGPNAPVNQHGRSGVFGGRVEYYAEFLWSSHEEREAFIAAIKDFEFPVYG